MTRRCRLPFDRGDSGVPQRQPAADARTLTSIPGGIVQSTRTQTLTAAPCRRIVRPAVRSTERVLTTTAISRSNRQPRQMRKMAREPAARAEAGLETSIATTVSARARAAAPSAVRVGRIMPQDTSTLSRISSMTASTARPVIVASRVRRRRCLKTGASSLTSSGMT